MGTNPKRTVTVQMVPQLAVVDMLSSKEPNANWAKDPNLKLSPVCPKTTLTSPDHKQDHLSLSASPTNSLPQTQTTACIGGEPVSSMSDKPAPTHGNQTKMELVNSGDQQMPDPSRTDQGEAGGPQRDSNANMKMLSLADEEQVFKTDVASGISASKDDMQNNDYRIKDLSGAEAFAPLTMSAAAAEDSNKHLSPGHRSQNNATELRHTASQPQLESKESLSAHKNKDSAAPQKSLEYDCIHRCSQSSVSLQEIPKPKTSKESTAAAVTPPTDSKYAEVGVTQKNPDSARLEKDCSTFKQTHVSSDTHQPMSSQTESFTLPKALQNTAANRQVAEDDSQTSTAVCEGQQHCKMYREASTMTISQSFTPVKQCHDTEVQAVANMCSKAVATSPSLLPFAVTCRTNGGAVLREEVQSLAVVYQVDRGVGLHQMNASTLSTSSDPRSERLPVEAELCPNQNARMVFHAETLSQQQGKGLGAKPKDSGTALCNTQPVYQINIEHSNHKDQGETGYSQNKTGVQASSVKTATTGAPSPKPGTPPKTAEPSQAAVTTKAKQTLPITTATRSDRTENKPGSLEEKSGAKVLTKETKSGKAKIEAESKEEEDDQSETEKGKSVHDVVWDEQGMTWEVYGASVDPESLGFAIQSHLQCKIKEQERKLMVRTSLRKSVSSVDSPQHGRKNKRRQQNIFRSMLQNVRRPNCCVRPPASSVLE